MSSTLHATVLTTDAAIFEAEVPASKINMGYIAWVIHTKIKCSFGEILKLVFDKVII